MRSDLTAFAPRGACCVVPRDVGVVIANLAFCYDLSVRWCWGFLHALSRLSATWCWGGAQSLT